MYLFFPFAFKQPESDGCASSSLCELCAFARGIADKPRRRRRRD